MLFDQWLIHSRFVYIYSTLGILRAKFLMNPIGVKYFFSCLWHSLPRRRANRQDHFNACKKVTFAVQHIKDEQICHAVVCPCNSVGTSRMNRVQIDHCHTSHRRYVWRNHRVFACSLRATIASSHNSKLLGMSKKQAKYVS
jgi:hypothetical protein